MRNSHFSPIVLMTDFGDRDGYVGAMKGVIHSISPGTPVIDLTHQIDPQDLDAARFIIWNQHRFFPSGSIFVCVVDPEVGSQRNILAAKTDQHLFIAPDNGLLDYVLSETRVESILQVENPSFFRSPSPSHTFYGRDIFAPAAAHLAAGELFTQLGPIHQFRIPESPFTEARPGLDIKILHTDHFGNIITDAKQSSWVPSQVQIGDQIILSGESYASVDPGDFVLIPGSHGLWEIAQRDGHAASALDQGAPMILT